MSGLTTEPGFTVLRRATRIVAMCNTCKKKKDVPNKGLGRAQLATWQTRHQHQSEAK